ncbi:hypothetical protein EF384_04575 [Aerococcus agrisoli]|uniref:WxL domain-containing protein n=1 Tax=Aerococcus agrisoli TaxID=2487350 RepID=A0A3N4GEV1_9LACT|nr:WxL domain-containing protein [Aerococcus agrisoli]RPA60725.1 hypothetical protein EF384_04575 [Aerococcus agrisoli]
MRNIQRIITIVSFLSVFSFGIPQIKAASNSETATTNVSFTILPGDFNVAADPKITFNNVTADASGTIKAASPFHLALTDFSGKQNAWDVTAHHSGFKLAGTDQDIEDGHIHMTNATVVGKNTDHAPIAPSNITINKTHTRVVTADQSTASGKWSVDWAADNIAIQMSDASAQSLDQGANMQPKLPGS